MCHTCMNDDEPWWISKSILRKYGPPSGWIGSPPPRGCEVFVGKLPRRLFEDELLPILSRPGRIYELRLMVDFNGSNRGYCFVVYATPEEAKRACQQLNNYEIGPGKHIGVVMSVDNRRLFVGGIPRDRSRQQVREEMEKLTDDVVDVILYPSVNDKSKNRGFAFVEYATHRTAACARKKLIPDRIQLWGHALCVDWAEPEQDVDSETMSNVKILYVRNLMLSTTEEQIRTIFENGRWGVVDRVKKMKDYAFVHFTEREYAKEAMDRLNVTVFDGSEIEVVWAKPPDKTIMRYVKDVQKMGVAPSVPTVHQSIVAAASQLYVASTKTSTNSSSGSPPGSSPPSPYSTIYPPLPGQPPLLFRPHDPVWAFAGTPFVDPGFVQPVPISNDSRFASNCARIARGAAGNRSAGFQAYINNQVRRNRKRFTENAGLMYEPTSMFVPYGLPIPPSPSNLLLLNADAMQMAPMPAKIAASFSEQLEHHCAKQNLGSPIYELTSFVTKDATGRDVPLYAFTVTVPGLIEQYGSFQPQEPHLDVETAREYASMFVLLQLGQTLMPSMSPMQICPPLIGQPQMPLPVL